MQNQTGLRTTAGQTAKAPTRIEIEAFRSALDRLIEYRGSDEEEIVSVLIDFLVSRCLSARELNDLGATLFKALHLSTGQAKTLGCFDERFQFSRFGQNVSMFVDDQRLATISVTDAAHLGSLLRGRDEAGTMHPQPDYPRRDSGQRRSISGRNGTSDR